MTALRALLLTGWSLLAAAPAARAQVFLGQDEALRLAFPEPATVERRTAFLAGEDLERARRLAGRGVEVGQSVVTYYVGRSDGSPLGAAYFDVHRVRTLPEAVMVVVRPDGRVARIEILKFSEPPEYLAPPGWLALFRDRRLEDDLTRKGAIVNMTGATLTSRAITDAARRVLALHEVIRPFAGTPGAAASPGSAAGGGEAGG